MLRKLTKKRMLLVGVLALVAATAAFAYFTSSGSGTGSASTSGAPASAVQITQTSTVSNLYPGGPSQALSGNIHNPNTGSVHVGSVTVSGITTDKVGCDATDYSVTGTSTPNADIAGGGDQAWSGLSIAMINKASSQDACQGATLTITYASN